MPSVLDCLRRVPKRLFCRLVVPLVILVLVGAGPSHGEARGVFVRLPLKSTDGEIRWDLETQVLRLINRERAFRGLTRIAGHEGLRRAARAHALDMLRYAYLSHQSRDGRGLQERAGSGNAGVAVLGENIGYAADIYATHKAFMASRGHRRIILTGQARLVGIGVVAVHPIGVIIVQDFGAPAEPPTGRVPELAPPIRLLVGQ